MKAENVVDNYQQDMNMARNGDEYMPYDQRRLSYAGTFTNPWKAGVIRTIEWFTGKIRLIRLIRKYEKMGVRHGQDFWEDCLKVLNIDLQTPKEQIARIPQTGPLVVVSNHPHGLLDGILLAALIGRVRTDYKVLTRSLLTGVEPIEEFMIPVAFPHEENSQRLNIEMRKKCMAHLKEDGVIVLFPAGAVAHSETFFGPAVETEWNPFTAKMILKSGATVLPIRFPGQNSRAYQIANKISATIRQGLLLHEVAIAVNTPQAPIIGEPIPADEIAKWADNPRGLMAHLRETTINL